MVFGDEFNKLSDDFVDRRHGAMIRRSLASVGVTYARRRVDITFRILS